MYCFFMFFVVSCGKFHISAFADEVYRLQAVHVSVDAHWSPRGLPLPLRIIRKRADCACKMECEGNSRAMEEGLSICYRRQLES